MRQVFTIRFLGDRQTAETITIVTKKGLVPIYVEEYRGSRGDEIHYNTFLVSSLKPRRWWEVWRK